MRKVSRATGWGTPCRVLEIMMVLEVRQQLPCSNESVVIVVVVVVMERRVGRFV